jgi:TRAP transporter TAXI family solute receptor
MKWLSCCITALLFVVLSCVLFPSHSSFAGTKFVTIGTGGVTGVYYPTGGAIAKMVNNKRKEYGLKVTAEATGGSVFNINALITGDMDLGIAQSDRAAMAWGGKAEWKGRGPQKSLRGVFALHHETICLIAAVNSGIKQCSDLKGKIVAIGNPGSGTRQNSIDALSICGLTTDDLGNAEGLKSAEAAGLLQDGRLDAYFFTVGHPNGSLKEAAAGTTKVRFVPFDHVEPLLKRKPFYTKAIIPVKMYPGVENDKDVPTFGVRAVLLSAEKVPNNVVYAVVKTVFENFDTFKKLHPAYANLKKKEMVKELPIPLHPGAIKYYKEAGLLQ